MGSSEGRRDALYLDARRLFQAGQYPCHICGVRPGTTPDHIPPLHTAPHWRLWRGTYKPACSLCQSRQGAAITNNRRRPTSRTW